MRQNQQLSTAKRASLDRILQLHQTTRSQFPKQRLMIALAGAPASGKSTLAAELVSSLNEHLLATGTQEEAIAVPMDGYHLDNAILRDRDQMAIKGSPETFDVAGFLSLIERLAVTELEPCAKPIYCPLFDRAIDLSRNAAQCIDGRHSIVVVEGNYLLLERPVWRELSALFHCRIMLDVPLEILQKRLIDRWLKHGLAPAQAQLRANSNDIPNAQIVLNESVGADLYQKSVRQ